MKMSSVGRICFRFTGSSNSGTENLKHSIALFLYSVCTI